MMITMNRKNMEIAATVTAATAIVAAGTVSALKNRKRKPDFDMAAWGLKDEFGEKMKEIEEDGELSFEEKVEKCAECGRDFGVRVASLCQEYGKELGEYAAAVNG